MPRRYHGLFPGPDRNYLRLGFLGLGQAQDEHAILDRRFRLAGVERSRERDAAAELPVAPLLQKEVILAKF
jgi:hypothetical protein